MRFFVLTVCFAVSAAFATAEVSITQSRNGWEMTNGYIRMQLVRAGSGVELKSLRREGGAEWASAGTPVAAVPDKSHSYNYTEDTISDIAKGGKQLTLHFRSSSGGRFSLILRIYPSGAVIQSAVQFENGGQHSLFLNPEVDPLFVTVQSPERGLKTYSSAEHQHGFQPAGEPAAAREFDNWMVLENQTTHESALVGGELGLGILGWKVRVEPSAAGSVISAGTLLLKAGKSGPGPVFELAPGEVLETPISFLALAKGDTDDAGNEIFRHLKHYVFQTPLPNSPLVTYCIWLTQTYSEEPILEELKLAKRVGFDVFYHDATWYREASVIPGMNDWTKGLGNYDENREKFPGGIKALSEAVHASGMKFGLWVDPGNVDASLVKSGQIPSDWLVMIDGKTVGTTHPSLTPTKQLCLGDPQVVTWIEKQLSDIIEAWHLDWIKWDPSATVSYECNRTNHGHGKTDGAYAAYRGRLEILRYLLKRFPDLSGFECDPSLFYSRTNPGPQTLLPGGYSNEFITGPMVSPNVWGSLAMAGNGDARYEYLTARWYSASALDYYFRKHFTHGVTFGNINGMTSQFLSAAPPGFIEAFQRNLLFFKQYRHLLLDDVYHPKLEAPGWSSIQYVDEHSDESVAFIFRDNSDSASNTIRLRGLDPTAKYLVTSFNDRPGRERVIDAATLMAGTSLRLPDEWLSKGDGGAGEDFAQQLRYGSDIWFLKRIP